MDKLWTVLETLLPIAAAMLLGGLIRKKNILSPEGIRGMQDFACKIGMPCLLFRSCYTTEFLPQTLVSMATILPTALALLCISLVLVHRGKPANLPLYFATKEGSMLGVPLFLVLFGQQELFRLTSLDVAQMFVAIPTLALVSAGADLTPRELVRRTLTTPMLLAAIAGLILNLSGLRDLLAATGVDPLVTTTADFLCAPISCVILVTIGYTFSFRECAHGGALKLSAVIWGVFSLQCLLIQGLLCLVPDTVPETRWAVFLYAFLPPSYLAPGLSRGKDSVTASGVCSICTIMTLAIFLLMTLLTA